MSRQFATVQDSDGIKKARASGELDLAGVVVQSDSNSNEKAFKQETQFSHFGHVIHIIHRFDVNRQCSIISFFAKLAEQLTVLDLTLADANLQLLLGRVTQMHVINVLNQLVDTAS